MNHKNPCSTCAEGGIACDDCLNSPQNSTPVKLYTPKGAARAMLVGKVLKSEDGCIVFWDKDKNGFHTKDNDGKTRFIYDFSGLWEEL
jgi:hypothetical protein